MSHHPVKITEDYDWDSAVPADPEPPVAKILAPVVSMDLSPRPERRRRDNPKTVRGTADGSENRKADAAAAVERSDEPVRTLITGRTEELPKSAEAEEMFLSCCLMDREFIARARDAGVRPNVFYDSRHGIIFDVQCGLVDADSPADLSAVAEELKKRKQLERVGSYPFLTQISGRVPTTADAAYYLARVLDLAHRRALLRVTFEAATLLRDESRPLDEIRAQIEPKFSAHASPAGAQKGYTLWRPPQFLEATVDPHARLVGEGVLELGAWASFLGIGGLGKTRLALWMIVCQITGREWCGLPTRGAPQRAVIFSGENGIPRWKHDLERMYQCLTESERELVDRHLLILALTADDDTDLTLDNPDTARRLKITLKKEAPGIVIFDPLADMLAGDENKAADVVASLRILRNVVRSSCPTAAVLLIHHSRTGAANVAQAGDNFNAGNFGRGSKTIYSAVRSEIQLAPQDRDDPNRLVISCGKANNGIKFSTRGIVFDAEKFTYSVDESFDVEAWRSDVAGKRRESSLAVVDVVEAVREIAPIAGDEATTKQIVDSVAATGASVRTVQRQLKTAVQQSYLRNGKKRGHWKLGAKPLPK